MATPDGFEGVPAFWQGLGLLVAAIGSGAVWILAIIKGRTAPPVATGAASVIVPTPTFDAAALRADLEEILRSERVMMQDMLSERADRLSAHVQRLYGQVEALAARQHQNDIDIAVIKAVLPTLPQPPRPRGTG